MDVTPNISKSKKVAPPDVGASSRAGGQEKSNIHDDSTMFSNETQVDTRFVIRATDSIDRPITLLERALILLCRQKGVAEIKGIWRTTEND